MFRFQTAEVSGFPGGGFAGCVSVGERCCHLSETNCMFEAQNLISLSECNMSEQSENWLHCFTDMEDLRPIISDTMQRNVNYWYIKVIPQS